MKWPEDNPVDLYSTADKIVKGNYSLDSRTDDYDMLTVCGLCFKHNMGNRFRFPKDALFVCQLMQGWQNACETCLLKLEKLCKIKQDPLFEENERIINKSIDNYICNSFYKSDNVYMDLKDLEYLLIRGTIKNYEEMLKEDYNKKLKLLKEYENIMQLTGKVDLSIQCPCGRMELKQLRENTDKWRCECGTTYNTK